MYNVKHVNTNVTHTYKCKNRIIIIQQYKLNVNIIIQLNATTY